jgi:hypothetical protein
MMHGRRKSDFAIVAVKPANKAAPSTAEKSAEETAAAESVERRARTKGNADRQSMHWTQRQARLPQALDRMRQALAVWTRGGRSYGAARRRLWHLPRPYELMEAAPWCKSTISAEA